MLTTVQALVGSGVLALLMFGLASALRSKPWEPGGMELAIGNRENLPTPTGAAGRADRAARNMIEAMVMFLAFVLAAQMAGKGAEAASGATVFFWSRLVYWPLYVLGVIYLRTAVWLVSLVGLAMIVRAIWQ